MIVGMRCVVLRLVVESVVKEWLAVMRGSTTGW